MGIIAMSLVISSITVAGCGKNESSNNKTETASENEEKEEVAKDDKKQDSDNSVDTKEEDIKEDTKEKQDEATQEDAIETVKEKYSFEGSLKGKVSGKETTDYSEFVGVNFWFSSGAGGWGTELNVEKDGSFSGEYHDSDMGTTGEGYPNGTVYKCDFTGKFEELVKVDEYRYKTRIDWMTYEKDPGIETIEDEVRIVYTDVYGLEEAEDIYFCMPGMPVSMLTEEELSWLMFNVDEVETKCYVVINKAAGEAFAGYKDQSGSYDVTEEYGESEEAFECYDGRSSIEIELEELEAKTNDMTFDLMNNDHSQVEMNSISGEIYKLWDDELNSLYGMAKQLESFDSIRKEQRIWLEYKEKRVENAGADWEGGSMRPLIENMEAYKITRQRVYELAEYVW